MLQNFLIVVVCDKGHKQVIRMTNTVRAFAEGYAGLLDGRSPMYIAPGPRDDPNSEICRCKAVVQPHGGSLAERYYNALIQCTVAEDVVSE